MDLIDTDKSLVPDIVSFRIPEKLKDSMGKLIRLEKRKAAALTNILLSEAIPIKQKIYDQKFILEPIELYSGEKLLIERHSKNYNELPFLEINVEMDGMPWSYLLSKENALSLAANLSIFLNEVHI